MECQPLNLWFEESPNGTGVSWHGRTAWQFADLKFRIGILLCRISFQSQIMQDWWVILPTFGGYSLLSHVWKPGCDHICYGAESQHRLGLEYDVVTRLPPQEDNIYSDMLALVKGQADISIDNWGVNYQENDSIMESLGDWAHWSDRVEKKPILKQIWE